MASHRGEHCGASGEECPGGEHAERPGEDVGQQRNEQRASGQENDHRSSKARHQPHNQVNHDHLALRVAGRPLLAIDPYDPRASGALNQDQPHVLP
jgi:hypothetical protein